MTQRTIPLAAEELARADEALTTVFAALDSAVGHLSDPEHGAALQLRRDVAEVARRVKALRTFVGGRR